jgi:hypothetical protein
MAERSIRGSLPRIKLGEKTRRTVHLVFSKVLTEKKSKKKKLFPKRGCASVTDFVCQLSSATEVQLSW